MVYAVITFVTLAIGTCLALLLLFPIVPRPATSRRARPAPGQSISGAPPATFWVAGTSSLAFVADDAIGWAEATCGAIETATAMDATRAPGRVT